MPVIKTTCPEPKCGAETTCWVGGLQHKTQHDEERSCLKHRKKYKKLREQWERELASLRGCP